MLSTTCPNCGFVLSSPTLFLSRGLAYFSISPHAIRSFETCCLHVGDRLADGVFGCPSMREALQPILASHHASPPPMDRMVDKEIMNRFLSLGDNCEFGLIQRWATAEPVDLMRFATFFLPGPKRLERLIEALGVEFEGLGDPDNLRCELHGTPPNREFMIRDTKWELFYHTNRHEGTVDADKLKAQQVATLQLRKRKLISELKSSKRILVWKSNDGSAEADIRHLIAELRKFGPNLLLWVQLADAKHPPGLVEYAGQGLLKGYVTRFAPYSDASDIAFEPWHIVCRNAVEAADFLQRCGEWSWPAPAAPEVMPPIVPPPMVDVALDDVADEVGWEERQSDVVARVGSVEGSSDFRQMKTGDWFLENPGITDIRHGLLRDVTLDSALALLVKDGRIIRDSRYLVQNEEYARAALRVIGMRFVSSRLVSVIGMNRPFRNYAHWMTQILPALFLSVSRLGVDRCNLVLPPLSPWQEETLAILGLKDLPRTTIDLSHHYHFGCVFYHEFLNGRASFFLSPKVSEVLDALAARVPPGPSSGPHNLYIARSDTANRPVTNEAEIRDVATRLGYVCVEPGSMSVRDQVRLFRGARIVAGPHGAGLTNLAFCRPGTKVLELVQSTYMNPCMARIAQVRRLSYRAELVRVEKDIQDNVHRQAWTVNPRRFQTLLEGLLAETS